MLTSTPRNAMESIDIDDRFVIETRVGQGAFGEVFRAVDHETQRRVAIKRLHAHVSDSSTVARFRLEARALSRVSHPNIVELVGFGIDAEERPCLVLEWLDGQDIGARRRRARPTPMESVEWVRQAALALDALHAAGIVHRDIKPSNFVVIERDRAPAVVKLIDLGIARVLDATRMTASGLVLGTPAYMSPEQARGIADVTPRSDLYSLGVMLYELLAGRRPFVADDMRALLAQILLQDVPPIDTFVALPAEVSSIVHQTLARAPEERFATGASLARALQDAARTYQQPVAVASSELDNDAATAATPLASALPRERRLVTIVFVEFPTRASCDGCSTRSRTWCGARRARSNRCSAGERSSCSVPSRVTATRRCGPRVWRFVFAVASPERRARW